MRRSGVRVKTADATGKKKTTAGYQKFNRHTGIEKGDVIAITSDRGRVIVKKAVVSEADKVPLSAKEAYGAVSAFSEIAHD